MADEKINNLEIDSLLGHYRILKKIGAGGMGEVFLAEDTRLERKVALKILPENLANEAERMRRFVLEAKSASALNHPNIITIYEIGEADSAHFIAAEYIEGETLNSQLKAQVFNLKTVLDIAIQVVSALDAAHRAGIVHRDIKPENVMIRPDGLVKLLDFGIAKLTEKKPESIDMEAATTVQAGTMPGMIIGTLNYMSPEQAGGKEIDARTDIFSFGIMLYEMLSGKLPFVGENALEIIVSILHNEPAPLNHALNVPRESQHIVEKCLRKDREERYQTAKDLLIDLKDIKQDLEFQNKLERTSPPNLEESKTQSLSAATSDAAHITSSAEFLVNEVKNHKRGFTIGLIVLLLASIGLGYWFFANRSTNARQINSIAILPFENGSGDASLDYLSDGLSEGLIDELSQLPQLKVIARSSSFKYRGANIDVQEVADKLGVQAIVMGKVVRVGDNLTVRVEMIDAGENRQLWSKQYNRKAAEALGIQQEIARTASEKLRLKLSGEQEQQLEKQGTVNPQAYELLLKGNFFLNKGGTDDWKKANEYYQQAIAVDPNYALAHAHLSFTYVLIGGSSLIDPKEIRSKAEAAARKAFDLDNDLPDAHVALANLHSDDWDWAAAEREFKRAIELNPNYGDAHREYSFYLSIIGRHDEAVAEAKRARELDPLGLVTNAYVGYALHLARRHDESIEVLQKLIELDPNFDFAYWLLGYNYAAKGMHREAITAYQNANRLGDKSPSVQIFLGAAYAQAGERGKAQEILKQLQTSKEYVSPGELAILYGALGNKEAAFQSLEKAYAEHDLQLQYLKADPAFDPLRSDARFQDLIRRVGFPQ